MTTGSNNMYPNLTGEEIIKFKETFIHFDPNGSGDENTATINTKDLGIIVRSLGFCPTEAEIKEMISEAESAVPLLDRVGKLSFLIFCNQLVTCRNDTIQVFILYSFLLLLSQSFSLGLAHELMFVIGLLI